MVQWTKSGWKISCQEYGKAGDIGARNIEKTAKKNEALIEALSDVITDTEQKIERMPKPLELPEKEFDFADEPEPDKEQSKEKAADVLPKITVTDRIHKLISSGRDRREVEEHLKDVQKEEAATRCKEIPYYEKSLTPTEILTCKDFECYSLLKKRENVYFGPSKNLKNKVYDNKDESLIELTEITEEFLQFMTTDILTDEYELRAFSEAEKLGMQMYFNFVSKCFENHIGTTLTVVEYLAFKRYYNRLVNEVLRLEAEKHRNYYRALPIAEQYMEIMASYDMVQSDSKREVVENIIAEAADGYVESLNLIMEHHIVDEDAKKGLAYLTEQIRLFKDEDHFTKKESEHPAEQSVEKPVQVLPAGFVQSIPMYQPGTAPFIGNIYFTLQCLDENRQVVDEAYFATANMPQAMEDYKSRDAYIKRFGLVQDGRFVPLLSSEGGTYDEE